MASQQRRRLPQPNTNTNTNGNSYADGNGYTDGNGDAYCYRRAEVYANAKAAAHATSSSISYSVGTVRFGELASEFRESRHRRGVSAFDALKVAFAGESSDDSRETLYESLRHDGTEILRKKS
jgi:hypothetical protein